MDDARAHGPTGTLAIFAWLFVLTVLEVGITFVPLPKTAMGILLVGMALGKALLVALFFMHLRFERRALGLIALTPLVLCVLLTLLLMPDATWSWRPN